MNTAIWKKAVSDAWRLLVGCCALLLLFSWVFVWLMSLMKMGVWARVLGLLPNVFQRVMDVPLAELATPVGQLSVLYVHAITLMVCVAWAVGRGSDPIAGEIGRGTMDLIVSLPIRRVTVLIVPSIVTLIGSALVAGSVPAGTWLGLLAFQLDGPVAMGRFLPGAINLFCMIFCLTGMTALVSAWKRDRWRTMSLTVGFFVLSLIVKLISRMWEPATPIGYRIWQACYYGSFLNAFQPQQFILMVDRDPGLVLQCNATLIGLGLICYVAAAVLFVRRDIPSAW